MSEGKTLKEIALELLEKYRTSETGVIWEVSGSIDEDTTKLEHECNYIRMQIERMAEQKWIPVTERLPEKKGWYIISHEKGIVTCDRWLGADGWDGFTHVKAWMQLPEPYKEDVEK